MICCHRSLTRKKRKAKKVAKMEEEKKWFWAIHPCLQIGCKLWWARLQKP
jgi:hypothetical protein